MPTEPAGAGHEPFYCDSYRTVGYIYMIRTEMTHCGGDALRGRRAGHCHWCRAFWVQVSEYQAERGARALERVRDAKSLRWLCRAPRAPSRDHSHRRPRNPWTAAAVCPNRAKSAAKPGRNCLLSRLRPIQCASRPRLVPAANVLGPAIYVCCS